jgi:mannose-6-phosphate isomerase-like protein (cupin superfamily)
MSSATLVKRGEGQAYWVLGDHVEFKIPAGAGGGRFTLAQTITVPGGGPPPHLHHNEDEVFYIVDGNFEFLVGQTLVPAPPGSLIFAPRNLTHQFRNLGPGRGTFICWVQPARFESFIGELGTAAAGVVDPPPVTPELMDKLARLCQVYGLEIRPDATIAGTAPAAAIPQPKWVLGLQVRTLCTGADSLGTLTVAELIVPTGAGAPIHRHAEQDEVFCVLDSRFEFTMGERTVVAEAGDAIYLPRQTWHSFKNTGATIGRLLDYHTPAGMEHFFTECAEPTPQTKRTPGQIAELCRKHGMELP